MCLPTLPGVIFPYYSRGVAGHRTAKRHYAVGCFVLVAKDPKACTALKFGRYSRQVTGKPISRFMHTARWQREVIIVRVLTRLNYAT